MITKSDDFLTEFTQHMQIYILSVGRTYLRLFVRRLLLCRELVVSVIAAKPPAHCLAQLSIQEAFKYPFSVISRQKLSLYFRACQTIFPFYETGVPE